MSDNGKQMLCVCVCVCALCPLLSPAVSNMLHYLERPPSVRQSVTRIHTQAHVHNLTCT